MFLSCEAMGSRRIFVRCGKHKMIPHWFQRQQPTRGGTVRCGSRDNSLFVVGLSDVVPETTAYLWWNCQMSSTSANCCQLIPQDRATVFPALGQLAAAELTHHSLKPLRLPYSSRLRLSLLLAGDIHPNPGPATQYPSGLGSSTVDQVLKYTKYPKYIPSTSTGQVLIFLKST